MVYCGSQLLDRPGIRGLRRWSGWRCTRNYIAASYATGAAQGRKSKPPALRIQQQGYHRWPATPQRRWIRKPVLGLTNRNEARLLAERPVSGMIASYWDMDAAGFDCQTSKTAGCCTGERTHWKGLRANPPRN